MGGPESTRWGTTLTWETTDGRPALDVRALARAGVLEPGATATVTWDRRAVVSVGVAVDDPDTVFLRYWIQAGAGPWVAVEQQVTLITTPCTFGGARPWFACPRCGSRCAVLYGLAGWFRCRGCHHLAYPSTRVPRAQRVGPDR